MQKTPVHEAYAAHAKIVDFHGWALPIQFRGIIDEHLHTRSKAGLYDCSHMGEFAIHGREAIAAFDQLVCADVSKLKLGRCRYTALLNKNGGIIDDCVVLRLGPEELFLITNAGPLKKVSRLLAKEVGHVTDLTAQTAKIDLQGPRSRDILLELGIGAVRKMRFWRGRRITWRGTRMVVLRAGYTGELGYELYVPSAMGPELWRVLEEHPLVEPCGLGARDTVRTEMGYPLNGSDLNESITPLEAGMERFIAWKSDFRGKARLKELRNSGEYSTLAALKSPSRRAPRHGFDLKFEGKVVGRVTSGTFGPSLGCGVGLGYLPKPLAEPGAELTAGPRDMPLTVAERPLYKQATGRQEVV